jgi:hypothetical protein
MLSNAVVSRSSAVFHKQLFSERSVTSLPKNLLKLAQVSG